MWGRGHFSTAAGAGALFQRLSWLASVCLALSGCNDNNKSEMVPEKHFVFTIDVSLEHRVDFYSEGAKLRVSFSSRDSVYEFDFSGVAPTDAAIVESGIYVLGKREKIDSNTIGSYKYHTDELFYCIFIELNCTSIHKKAEGFLSNLISKNDEVVLLDDQIIGAREGIHPLDTDVLVYRHGILIRKYTELGGIANTMLRNGIIFAIGNGVPEKKEPFNIESFINEIGILRIYKIDDASPIITETDKIIQDNIPICYDIYIEDDLMLCSYIHSNSKYYIIDYYYDGNKLEEILSISPRIYVQLEKLIYMDLNGNVATRVLKKKQGV